MEFLSIPASNQITAYFISIFIYIISFRSSTISELYQFMFFHNLINMVLVKTILPPQTRCVKIVPARKKVFILLVYYTISVLSRVYYPEILYLKVAETDIIQPKAAI